MSLALATTLISSFAILFIGFISLLHDRKSTSNILFFLISIVTVFWSTANYISINSDAGHTIMWVRLVLFFAAPHAILFFIFVYNFPSRTLIVPKKLLYFTLSLMVIIMGLSQTPLIFSAVQLNAEGHLIPVPGVLIPLYALSIVAAFIASLFLIFKKYSAADAEDKSRWRYMLVGTSISYALLIATNFLLVIIWGNVDFNAFGALFMLPTILGTGYAIIKYELFNVKAIAAEVLISIILIVTFSQILVSKTATEIALQTGIFTLIFVFSLFLIRSILKEVEQKEKIQVLANQLAHTNDQLFVANSHLKDLDRQKTEFVSIASHQLRSPLTAIKGYSSMLLEGSFGKLDTKVNEAVSRIYDSSLRLISTIEDFLNITRIELGKMKYDMSDINFGDLIKTISEEIKPNITKKGLTLVDGGIDKDCIVSADSGKISQVIGNVIDNASKYTPKGSLTIKLEKKDGKALFSVKDTGVGIKPETMPKLFEKFIRADDAGQTNILGTGLGLYVAKEIVQAHQGRIWAESEGEGRGSTFFVELALK